MLGASVVRQLRDLPNVQLVLPGPSNAVPFGALQQIS